MTETVPAPLSDRATVVTGFLLLAVFLPLGLTLEALHAAKVQVYFHSEVRREMWQLAHAHGNMLGILCLVYGGLAPQWIVDARRVRSIGWLIRIGAVMMPVGFFLGGIANSETDPSLMILLVPVGGLCLVVALLRAAMASAKVGGS